MVTDKNGVTVLTYTTVEGELAEKTAKLYNSKNGFIRVEPGGALMPPEYAVYGRKIRDFEVREDDIWVVSYPRTGSHWTQEMIWCIENNFDYEKAKTPLDQRTVWFERSALVGYGVKHTADTIDTLNAMKSPRYIKSHLPWDLLPLQLKTKKPKIIYMTRNPKDVCISYYHFCRLTISAEIKGTFEEFAKLFLQDMIPGPRFWNHVLEFWKHRDDDNILFLTYEGNKQDQAGVIRKAAKFLNKKVTDSQVEGLCDHLSFANMQKNAAVNFEYIVGNRNNPNEKFIRNGKVGDWRNYMSEELSQMFDDWTELNIKGSGLMCETQLPPTSEN